MKLLIAPLHYVADKEEGSEYSRAYDYLVSLSKKKYLSGDVLVGYCEEESMGNFKIHKMLNKKPKYISNIMRIRFILWIFLNGLRLISKNKYDWIWHNGPFSFNETFSLLALWNNKKIPFVIGPIQSPHIFLGSDESRSMGKKINSGDSLFIYLLKKFDNLTYFSAVFFKNLSDLTLSKAEIIITSNSAVEEILKKKKVNNFFRGLRGIDLSAAIKKNKKAPNKIINILNVSYLVERKKTLDLINALYILVNDYKLAGIKLTIVGDGPQMKKIKSQINKSNLEKYVDLLGFVPRSKVKMYYDKADLFISASVSESMPSMYFEAIQSKLPLVVVRNYTTDDFVKDGFKLYISKANNPNDLALQMHKAIIEKLSTSKYSIHNYEVLKSKYDLHNSINEFLNKLNK